MRDFSPLNPTNPSHGDWVAWVGTFDDLEQGRDGLYRIHPRRNYGNSTNDNIGDCGYTRLELHPDGPGKPPYILQVRLDLSQTDRQVKDHPELMK